MAGIWERGLKALASFLWVAEYKLWLQEIFFVRSIEHQGSLHKCLISRNNTVLQFDMNALHDEEKFKYWAQRTLHRHVYQCNTHQCLPQSLEVLRLTPLAKNKDGPSPSHTHKLLKHSVIGRLCRELETM